MGRIPAKSRMISTIITSPKNAAVIAPNTPITFSARISNLAPGSFTNPALTYYAAPQNLDNAGRIIGHTHVTVQKIDLNSENPPDPEVFQFFKGINDAGNGQGLLSATAEQGLPEGDYRVCTMTSASNHQPVLMPVAQRGAQDDCIRIVWPP